MPELTLFPTGSFLRNRQSRLLPLEAVVGRDVALDERIILTLREIIFGRISILNLLGAYQLSVSTHIRHE